MEPSIIFLAFAQLFLTAGKSFDNIQSHQRAYTRVYFGTLSLGNTLPSPISTFLDILPLIGGRSSPWRLSTDANPCPMSRACWATWRPHVTDHFVQARVVYRVIQPFRHHIYRLCCRRHVLSAILRFVPLQRLTHNLNTGFSIV